MQRTDKQIAEYMAYYRGTTERKAALEALARVEHKTPAEILAICAKINGKDEKAMPKKFSDEMKAEIYEKYTDGVPVGKIADDYHITPAQIHGILSAVRAKLRTQPEAYPGQIGDEPKYDERELEFEKHIDELEARRETLRPETPHTNEDFETEAATGKSGVWYALLAQLEEFAVGTFGKGTVFDSGAASSEKKIARLGVLTPDRKKVQITIEELGE